MANERKTENLVRNLLNENGYTDKSNIIIEEKASDNPRLVLTPPHITDFFCDIAGVTKDDVSVNLLSTEEIGNE